MLKKFGIMLLLRVSISTSAKADIIDTTQLPNKLQLKLKEYKVDVVPQIHKVEGYTDKGGGVIGTIDYTAKRILVEDKEDSRKRQIFAHEIGHLVDFKEEINDVAYYNYSGSKEWLAIWNEDQKRHDVQSWYDRNPIEAFANAVSFYIVDRPKLVRYSPKMDYYIDTIMKDYQ